MIAASARKSLHSLVQIAWSDIIVILILAPLSLLLIVQAAISLNWRLGHDTSLIHYVTFLITQKGYVPYRDVFDPSVPGTIWFHSLIAWLFDFDKTGFMRFNLIWLAALLSVTWGVMKQFDWRAAWGGVVLFGLFYLQAGRPMMLQRDCVLILPLGLALLVYFSGRLSPAIKAILIGGLIGLCATIKPHAAIALPILALFDLIRPPDDRPILARPFGWRSLGIIGAYLGGFSAPILAAVAWIWQAGSWPYFVEMYVNYLPLHINLNHYHQTIFGFDRIKYLIKEFLLFGGNTGWFTAAVLGVYISLYHANFPSRTRHAVYLLTGLMVLFGLYTILAGQFWPYHWMPFNYFVIMLAALCLINRPQAKESMVEHLYPLAVVILTGAIVLRPTPDLLKQLRGEPPFVLEGQRVDDIAGFLKANLRPGDKVQPLDWSGGSVHAMLLAEAEPATQFIYDYHFYHHISNPFIQTLRQRFISGLERARPRFMIKVETLKPWVSGPDSTREFKELRQILDSDYAVVFKGDGYQIYERKAR